MSAVLSTEGDGVEQWPGVVSNDVFEFVPRDVQVEQEVEVSFDCREPRQFTKPSSGFDGFADGQEIEFRDGHGIAKSDRIGGVSGQFTQPPARRVIEHQPGSSTFDKSGQLERHGIEPGRWSESSDQQFADSLEFTERAAGDGGDASGFGSRFPRSGFEVDVCDFEEIDSEHGVAFVFPTRLEQAGHKALPQQVFLAT